MREIEFKAWSPSKKEWRADWSLSTYEVVLDLNAERVDDDLILVQFTGLRDLRGVKIFEGDFLRDRFGRIFEVFWMAGVTEYDMEAGWWVRKHEGDCREAFTMHQWRDNKNLGYEVAGNVYENPELLGGKP